MDQQYRPMPGTPVEDLETPCLILDMDALDHNMDVMADYYEGRKARAWGLIEDVKETILQKYPDREFEVVEFGPKDYRLIVRGGRGELEGIHKALDGRTTDILVDHDIWIVIPCREDLVGEIAMRWRPSGLTSAGSLT